MSSFHEDRREREDRRNEHRLRQRLHESTGHVWTPPRDEDAHLDEISARVRRRCADLVNAQPHLAGADPRTLLSRMVVATTVLDGESALNRAAMGLLLVRAVERVEELDVTSGGDAAA